MNLLTDKWRKSLQPMSVQAVILKHFSHTQALVVSENSAVGMDGWMFACVCGIFPTTSDKRTGEMLWCNIAFYKLNKGVKRDRGSLLLNSHITESTGIKKIYIVDPAYFWFGTQQPICLFTDFFSPQYFKNYFVIFWGGGGGNGPRHRVGKCNNELCYFEYDEWRWRTDGNYKS